MLIKDPPHHHLQPLIQLAPPIPSPDLALKQTWSPLRCPGTCPEPKRILPAGGGASLVSQEFNCPSIKIKAKIFLQVRKTKHLDGGGSSSRLSWLRQVRRATSPLQEGKNITIFSPVSHPPLLLPHPSFFFPSVLKQINLSLTCLETCSASVSPLERDQ